MSTNVVLNNTITDPENDNWYTPIKTIHHMKVLTVFKSLSECVAFNMSTILQQFYSSEKSTMVVCFYLVNKVYYHLHAKDNPTVKNINKYDIDSFVYCLSDNLETNDSGEISPYMDIVSMRMLCHFKQFDEFVCKERHVSFKLIDVIQEIPTTYRNINAFVVSISNNTTF